MEMKIRPLYDRVIVKRTALQNAASVSGLILTTGATIADAPKEDKRAQVPAPELEY